MTAAGPGRSGWLWMLAVLAVGGLLQGCATASSVMRLRHGPSGATPWVEPGRDGSSLRWRVERSRVGYEPFSTAASGRAGLPPAQPPCAALRLTSVLGGRLVVLSPGERTRPARGGPLLPFERPDLRRCDLLVLWAPRPGSESAGTFYGLHAGFWYRLADAPLERPLREPALWVNPWVAPAADWVVTPLGIGFSLYRLWSWGR